MSHTYLLKNLTILPHTTVSSPLTRSILLLQLLLLCCEVSSAIVSLLLLIPLLTNGLSLSLKLRLPVSKELVRILRPVHLGGFWSAHKYCLWVQHCSTVQLSTVKQLGHVVTHHLISVITSFLEIFHACFQWRLGKKSRQGIIISSGHFPNFSQMNFQQTGDYFVQKMVLLRNLKLHMEQKL